MPDLNSGRKLTSKNDTTKRLDTSTRTSHSSSMKAGDKRKPEREAHRSPPKRRGARRSRSSSSGTSDSSSSGSESSDSSDSASSSSKESPKKTAQPKQSKEPERSKVPVRNQKSKPESTTAPAIKSDTTRTQREQAQKRSSGADDTKTSDAARAPAQPRSKSNAVAEATHPTSATAQRGKTGTSRGEENADPAKTQSIPETSSKSAKLVTVEVEKSSKDRSRSPAAIPPFTRVLVEKLTRNVNSTHVAEIFSVWGEVANVEMPPDRLHPEFSRSYAYVTYKDPKCAADAVNFMNGGQVDGETIRVTEVFSRPSTSARSGGDANTTEATHHRERGPTKRDSDKPDDQNRDRRNNIAPAAGHRHAEDSRERPNANELDRRRENQDRRDRERQRDRSRDLDRQRRARRGSSGSPFANRMGPSARQRSPVAGSRYRRTSPLSSRLDANARRGRSRSPKPTKPVAASRPGADAKSGGRRGRKISRSSSSSSSGSGTSNSSSSGSRSGSSSSSSSSSSSRSRT